MKQHLGSKLGQQTREALTQARTCQALRAEQPAPACAAHAALQARTLGAAEDPNGALLLLVVELVGEQPVASFRDHRAPAHACGPVLALQALRSGVCLPAESNSMSVGCTA
eukprot:3788649-Rhodomonas_salina.2